MTSIFICYSRKDKSIVEEVVDIAGLYIERDRISDNVFYDRNMTGGTEWWEEIVNHIEGCDIFIYLLSEDSIVSEFCQNELNVAILLAKRIIPVTVRPIEEIPRSLRHINVLDLKEITPRTMAELFAAIRRYEHEARYLPDDPGHPSLFDVRRSHFAPEKERLCESITKKVLQELEKDEKQKIILILDAGSTVYPVFELLCDSHLKSDPSEADRLKIVTNNLPGARAIVRYGRVGQRHQAKTVFQTRLLRGFINVQYEASLSAHTATDLCAAIGEYLGLQYPAADPEWQHVARTGEIVQTRYGQLLKEQNEESYAHFKAGLDTFCQSVTAFKAHIDQLKPANTKIISITTGNYVSISEGPLARDKNHVQTKSTMIGMADEAYVLAPLGKLLPWSREEINTLNQTKEYDTMYHDIPNWSDLRNSNVTLAFTTRPNGYFNKLKSPELTTYLIGIQTLCKTTSFRDRIQPEYDPSTYPGVSKRAVVLFKLEEALREYEMPHNTLRENVLASI